MGYGLSGDAYHIAAPSGEGAQRSMEMALGEGAQLRPEDMAISTPMAPQRLKGMWPSSKPCIVCLARPHKNFRCHRQNLPQVIYWAPQVVQRTIFSLKTLESGLLPPTLNLHEPEETDIDLVPFKARKTVSICPVSLPLVWWNEC